MAGAQDSPQINRGLVAGIATGVICTILFAWFLAVRIAHGRPHGELDLPTGMEQEHPRFGMLEQQVFALPAPDPYREEAEQRLSNYGWVDSGHRFARVPMARAKQLLLEHRGGR